MSFQAMAWAVKQKVGNATGKAILLMLANYADERGECFPSQERLADECECSVATVARWVKAFEEMGFLSRQKQYGEGGYRRADRLRICTDLPVTKLPITELPSRELPNSGSKLTRQKAGAEPISTLSSVSARKLFDQFWSLYPHKVGKLLPKVQRQQSRSGNLALLASAPILLSEFINSSRSMAKHRTACCWQRREIGMIVWREKPFERP